MSTRIVCEQDSCIRPGVKQKPHPTTGVPTWWCFFHPDAERPDIDDFTGKVRETPEQKKARAATQRRIAADAIKAQELRDVVTAHHEQHPQPPAPRPANTVPKATAAAAAARPKPVAVPAPTAAPAAVPTATHRLAEGTLTLLQRGEQHTDRKVRAAAEKAHKALDLLAEELQRHEDRAEAARVAARKAARDKVARLERELAQARTEAGIAS